MDYKTLKDAMRGTWMAGDFGQIARHSEKAAGEFVARLSLQPNVTVLDVACGTGNLALPAARAGARVTGVDIAPNLLEQGRQRAKADSLNVHFQDGDAEQLPFTDESFDVVMSMFGAMFAPRPELAASELMRVCRKGGLVAMANWTPQSFSGKMFRLTGKYITPPEAVPPPVLWGEDSIVRQRFGGMASEIDTVVRPIVFDFPKPPEAVVQLFRDYFGPTKMAFARLDREQGQNYAADLERLWADHNQAGPDRTLINNEYLEVRATRA